jgi:hypothetical protein
LQRFQSRKQELSLPDDYGVGDIDAGKFLTMSCKSLAQMTCVSQGQD